MIGAMATAYLLFEIIKYGLLVPVFVGLVSAFFLGVIVGKTGAWITRRTE